MHTHTTAAELVAAWDAEQIIWTLAMGGLGPSYEQALQILAVEITRDALTLDLGETEASFAAFERSSVATIERVADAIGGPTGAMAGASRFLAWRWLTVGPARFLENAREQGHESRIIQCSRFYPHAPAPPTPVPGA